MPTAIKFDNISKQYRLGLVSTRTLSHDLNRWWQTSIRGKEDPYLTIGSVNDRSTKADSDYVWALRDINFEVEQGDVVGIIGKNGAGKSTLLKILSKVTAPTTGTIKAKGRIASLLEIGTGFHPEMTGRENIFMNGAIMGMTRAEISRKFDEIVDFAGVERYIDTPVKRYSSGMTVRLGFAVAAFLEPEILVVDEVLAVGDAEFQKKAIGKMQNISHGDGRTVLFVSHNMGSIKTLCNKGILLANGTVQTRGDIYKIVSEYLDINTSTTKFFIDSFSYKAPYIQIDKITINNQNCSPILLMSEHNQLNIHIDGQLYSDQKIAIEFRLYDKNQIPLAFYSPFHYSGNTPTLKKGLFKLDYIIYLPKEINKGSFIGSLFLTNPGINYHLSLENIIQIDIEGFPTQTGHTFEYDKGAGFLFLR